MNTKELTKEDIVNYFSEQKCEDCPFKEECDQLTYDYDVVSICTLFGAL